MGTPLFFGETVDCKMSVSAEHIQAAALQFREKEEFTIKSAENIMRYAVDVAQKTGYEAFSILAAETPTEKLKKELLTKRDMLVDFRPCKMIPNGTDPIAGELIIKPKYFSKIQSFPLHQDPNIRLRFDNGALKLVDIRDK